MPELHRVVLDDTPVGPLTLVASNTGLREVRFGRPSERAPGVASLAGGDPAHPVLTPAMDALRAYFSGDESALDGVPVDPARGSPFQRAVWAALRAIPRGEVTSYGALATELGQGSARSVGQAVGANPLPVVIPCHRVVTSDGRLGGFSGGLERKVALLELEGFHAEGTRFAARLLEDAPTLSL